MTNTFDEIQISLNHVRCKDQEITFRTKWIYGQANLFFYRTIVESKEDGLNGDMQEPKRVEAFLSAE